MRMAYGEPNRVAMERAVASANCSSRRWMRVILILAGIFVSASSIQARQSLTEFERIQMIRSFVGKIAVAKIELPLGKRGVVIDTPGGLNEKEANHQLYRNGDAVRAGALIEITNLEFKRRRIVFEINGGKEHEKWYQHIQIGVGGPGMGQDDSQAPAKKIRGGGSYITIAWRKKIPEHLTSAEAKRLLAVALDFHRRMPTVLYSPSLPPKFKKAIQSHKVLVGMDRDDVLAARGIPDSKARRLNREGDVTQVDWVYGRGLHALFVTFKGDRVVAIHQH